MSDVVTCVVVAGSDEFGRVARELLAVVGPGRESEVQVVTIPHRGFRVPCDVAVEYARRRETPPSSVPAPVVEVPMSVADEVPRPRRGRPRKSEVQQ